MNVHTLKALVWDALYQVLDNSVFRILALLTALPILSVFLIGFREDEIVFLFGVESWDYESVLKFIAAMQQVSPRDIADPQGVTIEALLSFVFDTLVGVFGVLFCIAATAFFVPRMIEKGAADVLFHKPISRFVLYLARYLAGLLFIGILSLILVGGMYIGLLFVSGHHDLGIFVAAFQLTYVFGLIYAVCMLIGVVTRSTVASILLTVIFFAFNGCIHQFWIALEQNQDFKERESEEAAAVEEALVDPETTAEEGEEDDEEGDDDDDHPWYLRFLFGSLRTAHYVLPKTNDGPFMAQKLRSSIGRPVYRDEGSLVTLYTLPADATRIEPEELDLATGADDLGVDLGELRFAATFTSPPSTFTLWRRPLSEEEITARKRTIVRRENPTRTASELEKLLEDDEDMLDIDREALSFGGNSKGSASFGSAKLSWARRIDGEPHARMAILFRGAEHVWLYTALLAAQGPPVGKEGLETVLQAVNRSMALDRGTQATWYQKQLAFDAPLPFNLFFSLGSSLAFAALMLVLGWWRLSRIEF